MQAHQHELKPFSSTSVDVSFQNPLPGRKLEAPFLARTEHCNVKNCLKCERQYSKAGIGVVVSGLIDYRAQLGSGTGVPGTVFFGNVDEFYKVDHLDTRDLQRIAVWYEAAFLEEIAGAYDVDTSRFHLATLPPGKAATSLYGRMQALTRGWGDKLETAVALAVAGLTIQDESRRKLTLSSRDRRRILAVVTYMERSFSEPCSIDTLASMCGLSRFHFMRLFKSVTGLSPNQYVIGLRLRAAATRIAETAAPISEIALGCGFNDISHFNTSFRAMYGCTPRQIRN